MRYFVVGIGSTDLCDLKELPERVPFPGDQFQIEADCGNGVTLEGGQATFFDQFTSMNEAVIENGMMPNLTLRHSPSLSEFDPDVFLLPGINAPDFLFLCNGTEDTCPTNPENASAGKHTCDGLLAKIPPGDEVTWWACTSLTPSDAYAQASRSTYAASQEPWPEDRLFFTAEELSDSDEEPGFAARRQDVAVTVRAVEQQPTPSGLRPRAGEVRARLGPSNLVAVLEAVGSRTSQECEVRGNVLAIGPKSRKDTGFLALEQGPCFTCYGGVGDRQLHFKGAPEELHGMIRGELGAIGSAYAPIFDRKGRTAARPAAKPAPARKAEPRAEFQPNPGHVEGVTRTYAKKMHGKKLQYTLTDIGVFIRDAEEDHRYGRGHAEYVRRQALDRKSLASGFLTYHQGGLINPARVSVSGIEPDSDGERAMKEFFKPICQMIKFIR
ncbi:hypothetical protein ACFQ78_33560 [Streptomyces sp. NPDC056519]|uniref:hypothetical protein n=1 Tax=Streptomyces sp. NPDC056519 TaxID=3345849 RepID=UPI0036B9EF3E